MALKFLNKKGWHTGSLRNIENVWKAEQKHEAEQRKLEELRKQILEERERSEFRLLQEQAGLVPHQERLEFLYDSGLAVGKGNSEGFKALETLPRPENEASSSSKQASTPGALFEEKPQSANDAWRKLHSDPLLMIRQREQEALAKIKNNPVKMAMIRKSVEAKKHKDATDNDEHVRSNRSKHRGEEEDEEDDFNPKVKSKHRDDDGVDHKKARYKHRDGDDVDQRSKHRDEINDKEHKEVRYKHRSCASSKNQYDMEDQKIEVEYRSRRRKEDDDDGDERISRDLRNGKQSEGSRAEHQTEKIASQEQIKRHEKSKHESPHDEVWMKNSLRKERRDTNSRLVSESNDVASASLHGSHRKRRNAAPKLSEEEMAARLRGMQVDAQLHEEQRWKRLKKAEEDDAREARQAGSSSGKSFLDDANKSVYGAEKGGRFTIEESVRRRAYFHQDRSQSDGRNAFRR
ncbi:hypothetical protein Dimus_011055 [Dionaea muscipula]